MEFRIDFHIHTNRSSDGIMGVRTVFETARRAGLNGIAVTDHNEFASAYEALAREERDLLVVPGVEVSTERGHILCYFVGRGPTDAGLERRAGVFSFDEVVEYARAEGGLIFAAHPYRGSETRIADVLDLLDGIEIFNGRNTSRDQRTNLYAAELVRKHSLAFVAGSDAHTPGEVGRAQRIFAFDRQPLREDLRGAMLQTSGSYYGQYSPLGAQGRSAIRRSLRNRRWDRVPKDLIKIAVGALIDPVNLIRPINREIAGGKQYTVVPLE